MLWLSNELTMNHQTIERSNELTSARVLCSLAG